MTTEQKDKNTASTIKGLVILFVCLAVIFLCAVVGGDGDDKSSSVPTVRTSLVVKYVVTSTVSEFDITYNNEGGNTEQKDLRVREWEYTADVEPGYFAYISAQIGGTGTISCKIYLNGKVIEEATSEGRFVIASCSDGIP